MIIQQKNEESDYIGKIQKYYENNKDKIFQEFSDLYQELNKNSQAGNRFESILDVSFNYLTGEIHPFKFSSNYDRLDSDLPINFFASVYPGLGDSSIYEDADEYFRDVVRLQIPKQIQTIVQFEWERFGQKSHQRLPGLTPLEFRSDGGVAKQIAEWLLQLNPDDPRYNQRKTTLVSLLSDSKYLDGLIETGLYERTSMKDVYDIFSQMNLKKTVYDKRLVVLTRFLTNDLTNIQRLQKDSYLSENQLLHLEMIKWVVSNKSMWNDVKPYFKVGNYRQLATFYYPTLSEINKQFSKFVQN